MPQTKTAADIMTTRLVTLKPEMNVMVAVKLLLRHNISGAPVVDGQGGLIGILSELDCVNHIVHRAMENLPPLEVSQLMTKEVYTVLPGTTLPTLADLFTTKRFRRLPVVDKKGKLRGQVSRRDLLRGLDELMLVRNRDEPGPLYLSALDNEAPAKVR
ncbi:MAG: CBS domain-containing protein [Myxococcota bacterium]